MVSTTRKFWETDLSKEVAKAKARNKAYVEKLAKAKTCAKRPAQSKGKDGPSEIEYQEYWTKNSSEKITMAKG